MRSAPHLVLPGHHGWLVLALAIFALSKPGDIQAQQEPKQGKEAPAQTTPPPTPVIEIKIRTSGKRFVPGDPVGAMADITNKSNVPLYLRAGDVQFIAARVPKANGPLYLRAGDVQFILALETNGGLSSCDSWFPNVTREDKSKDKSKSGDAMKQVICLKPGRPYIAFAVCHAGKWYQEFRF